MRKLTKAEKERIWEEVKKEFPNDETMQEIHYVRLMHYLQTKGLSPKERIRFLEVQRNHKIDLKCSIICERSWKRRIAKFWMQILVYLIYDIPN